MYTFSLLIRKGGILDTKIFAQTCNRITSELPSSIHDANEEGDTFQV